MAYLGTAPTSGLPPNSSSPLAVGSLAGWKGHTGAKPYVAAGWSAARQRTTVGGPAMSAVVLRTYRFPALRHRDFRTLWIGLLFASGTMAFQYYAQIWLIFRL